MKNPLQIDESLIANNPETDCIAETQRVQTLCHVTNLEY